MSLCPVCQTEIQDAFGLVQCPNCKTMLVAEFDGSLKLQSEEVNHSDEDAVVASENAEPAVQADEAQDLGGSYVPSESQPSEPWDLGAVDSVPVAETQSPIETPVIEELKEIQRFGESDASKLSEGDLIYNLLFENVVTQELKAEILAELKDKRFMIREDSIDIKDGTIHVKGLNPVKLSVLVTKLKHLPIQISWDQNSLTQ